MSTGTYSNPGYQNGTNSIENMIERHIGPSKASPAQKSFWQAITVGDLETVKCLLQLRNISINQYDEDGEQRQGGTALHLAILEMPTWKGSEGRNGIQTSDFVRSFFQCLLEAGADIETVCRYKGEWYLQTAAGKTKSFFPFGYDSLGLVLQFIEITRGADVIAHDVTKRLELIRDLLLEHIQEQESKRKPMHPSDYKSKLSHSLMQLVTHQKFTDVELKCEGRSFKAHRAILAARSDVFDTMFSSSMKEGASQSIVSVEEVDPDILQMFLHFIYTDTISPEHAGMVNACELLILANRYDVPDLKDLCTRILAHSLDVSNAATVLSIADNACAHELKAYTLQFISNNIKAVREASDDYATLDANLMRDILDSCIREPQHKRFKSHLTPSSHGHRSPFETKSIGVIQHPTMETSRTAAPAPPSNMEYGNGIFSVDASVRIPTSTATSPTNTEQRVDLSLNSPTESTSHDAEPSSVEPLWHDPEPSAVETVRREQRHLGNTTREPPKTTETRSSSSATEGSSMSSKRRRGESI